MKTQKYILLAFGCLMLSCEPFLEIDPPKTSLVQESVYQNNETATAAMLGIYSGMAGFGYASGGNNSITVIAGLSADEFINSNSSLNEFFNNQVSANNSVVRSLYLGAYQHIFATNAVLEGLGASKAITPDLKAQLSGEAYFVRAFVYFYLTNLFGSVPLQLTTDYRVTRLTPLSTANQVYTQIIIDLKMAESLLTDQYPSAERVRPNRSAAQALLARVYLYQKDWVNAEKCATLVIAKTGTYSLPALDNVFLKNSPEAIWQLFPTAGTNANEGNLFILTATPINVSLNTTFAIGGFEPGDKRKSTWIKSYNNAIGTWYYPFKYKVKSSSSISEYSMVFRLAEQYLIRAEARAQQNNLEKAISDLDQIRGRAGLPLIKDTNPGITQPDLLAVIQKERKAELFSEWGHRWLDLKRLGLAGGTLSPLKPNWQDTDVYYPLPADEVSRNPNIN